MTSTSGSAAHITPVSQTRVVVRGRRNAVASATPDTACVRTVGTRLNPMTGRWEDALADVPRNRGSRGSGMRPQHDLREAFWSHPLTKGRLDVVGIEPEVAFGGAEGLVERQVLRRTGEETLGDVLLAGLAERDVAEEQPAGLEELLGTNRRRPHIAEVALDDRARACDILRIACVLELDQASGLRHVERRTDVIDEATALPQVAVEARRIEGAHEDVIPEIERVVIGARPVDAKGLGEPDLVLDARRIGYNESPRAARWHRRQVSLRRRPAGGPGAERPFDHGARLVRCDLSDHDDRREVGAEGPTVVRPDVVEAERLDGRWCRLPERRIVRREQRSFERSLREVLRALQPAGKLRHERRAHRAEGLLGQAGVDHVI